MKITFEWDSSDNREVVMSCVKTLEKYLYDGKLGSYNVGRITVCDQPSIEG